MRVDGVNHVTPSREYCLRAKRKRNLRSPRARSGTMVRMFGMASSFSAGSSWCRTEREYVFVYGVAAAESIDAEVDQVTPRAGGRTSARSWSQSEIPHPLARSITVSIG